MQHQNPQEVSDKRPKTRELAQRFRVEEWDLEHCQKQCLAEQRSYQQFLKKTMNIPLTGYLPTRRTG
jgi:hypothetical protein